tara:strand:- start:928 stop:1284 length:357 start_codon:yes stop_codon:yes gene_type:complete
MFSLPGTAQTLEFIGLPEFLTHLFSTAETVGGMPLIFGLYTRWVVAVLIAILIGALLVHAPNGWVFSATGFSWEYPVFLILESGVLTLTLRWFGIKPTAASETLAVESNGLGQASLKG